MRIPVRNILCNRPIEEDNLLSHQRYLLSEVSQLIFSQFNSVEQDRAPVMQIKTRDKVNQTGFTAT